MADVAAIGFVVNVASGVIIDRQDLEHAFQKLGIKSIPAEVHAPNDLDGAFRALSNDHVRRSTVAESPYARAREGVTRKQHFAERLNLVEQDRSNATGPL